MVGAVAPVTPVTVVTGGGVEKGPRVAPLGLNIPSCRP